MTDTLATLIVMVGGTVGTMVMLTIASRASRHMRVRRRLGVRR